MSKMRLDVLLAQMGNFDSREKARAVIMSGLVYVDGQKADKAGLLVSADANIEVRGGGISYVSRGGLKLEKALDEFGISLDGCVAMDVGASTGGFTDCMLQRGAKKVYAVDVGYGQLAWQLRIDERVVVMERTNIRYIDKSGIELIDFASIDVSFISLRLVLPIVWDMIAPGGSVICLVKPQFEAGREKVGKKGVVRDKKVHLEVLESIVRFAESSGYPTIALTFSPIKGPEGNIEYLLMLQKGAQARELFLEEIVGKSHDFFIQ